MSWKLIKIKKVSHSNPRQTTKHMYKIIWKIGNKKGKEQKNKKLIETSVSNLRSGRNTKGWFIISTPHLSGIKKMKDKRKDKIKDKLKKKKIEKTRYTQLLRKSCKQFFRLNEWIKGSVSHAKHIPEISKLKELKKNV